MSQVQPDIDLGALARKEAPLKPPRRSALRILVPAVILLTFIALLVSTLGDLWRGTVEVDLVRPRIVDASSSASAGTALFQAAGWIEPDPFATEVTALAPGVVREMLVQESDKVEAGQVVARLVERDAELACDAAEAMLAEANADLARARAEAQAAATNWETALGVKQALDVARAEAGGRAASAEQRAKAAVSAEAQVKVAEEELALQQELAGLGAAGPRQVELAQARIEDARGILAQMRAEAEMAKAEVERAKANLERAERDFELRIDDRRALDTTRAMVALAEAKVAAVQVTCDEAKLRLARMEVRAPSAGIVLERRAAPGTSLDAAQAVVCTLYDPHSIRVRVDIPQGEVGKVGVGMQAEVLAESRPGKPYRGEVIRLVHRADIQKVTLQVHVRLADGDELVRPEMLVQTRFLSSGSASGGTQDSTNVVLVPARLVSDGHVWVVDGATGTAAKRKVELGARTGDDVEIKSGVNASDKLIDARGVALEAGARVRGRSE
ncbi:MAG: efflux RND transporter periplasmic adaptor subunit [Planctomycetota bacterium]|nr:efflux RND transporter periplasmic adaptor subunit [Planctomycetota bacterium]